MNIVRELSRKYVRATNDDLELSLKAFLKKTPRKDDEVHAFSKEQGINPHELEGMVYSITYKALNGQYLKNWDAPDDKFDPKELAKGIKVEFEHTKDKTIAKVIAKAHLMEFPNYYTKLDAMEKDLRTE